MPACAPTVVAQEPSRAIFSATRMEEILSSSNPPNLCGTSVAQKPSSAAFFRSSRSTPGFLLFDFVQAGHNFLVDEFLRRLRNQAMLFRDVFGREHLFRRARFNQKAATLDSLRAAAVASAMVAPPALLVHWSRLVFLQRGR